MTPWFRSLYRIIYLSYDFFPSESLAKLANKVYVSVHLMEHLALVVPLSIEESLRFTIFSTPLIAFGD